MVGGANLAIVGGFKDGTYLSCLPDLGDCVTNEAEVKQFSQ